jgi:hypothetical protein
MTKVFAHFWLARSETEIPADRYVSVVYFRSDSGAGRKVPDMIEGAVGGRLHLVLTHRSEPPFSRALRLENQ